jgi:hypothetical protein
MAKSGLAVVEYPLMPVMSDGEFISGEAQSGTGGALLAASGQGLRLHCPKRFSKSAGWGYALFNYEAASDEFTADPSPSEYGQIRRQLAKAAAAEMKNPMTRVRVRASVNLGTHLRRMT